MTTPTPPTSPPAGSWVEAWLSAPRFAVYLTATGGDRARALALYEWNAQLSAALLHDLAHLEVGLRNAYDVVLSTRWAVRRSGRGRFQVARVTGSPRAVPNGRDAQSALAARGRSAGAAGQHPKLFSTCRPSTSPETVANSPAGTTSCLTGLPSKISGSAQTLRVRQKRAFGLSDPSCGAITGAAPPAQLTARPVLLAVSVCGVAPCAGPVGAYA